MPQASVNKFALLAAIIAFACSLGARQPGFAETFKLGTQEAVHLIPAEVIFSPQPSITEEMLEQGIKTTCVARFCISETGKHDVHLLTSSGSEQVDELTLSTLRTWKFKPGRMGTTPVPSVRKIRVEFEVE